MSVIRLNLVLAIYFMSCFACFAQDNSDSHPVTFKKVFSKGKEWQLLQQMVGDWDVGMKLWLRAGAKPIEAPHFRAKRIMIGNFIQEVAHSKTGTDSFTRVAYFNYNAIQRQWETIVLDTRYPLMMFETSAEDGLENGNTITFYMPAFVMPPFSKEKESGQLTKLRQTLTIEKDKNIIRQYWTPAGEREYLAIEYEYGRVAIIKATDTK